MVFNVELVRNIKYDKIIIFNKLCNFLIEFLMKLFVVFIKFSKMEA